MNIDAIKMELIDWIAQLKDQQAIGRLLVLKKKLNAKKSDTSLKLFGSGKNLVEYIAEDFNAPVEVYKEGQK